MKQLLTTSILLLALMSVINAQITFQKTYGGINVDGGYDIKQTYDGGYIICGLTKSFGAGSEDIYLVKTNINGDVTWTKTFGGAGQDFGFSIQQTTDSGYIITGSTSSFGSILVYVIKTNEDGDLLWSKTFGGTYNDNGYSVRQTSDKGYIIAGRANIAGKEDVFLIKTTSNGDTLWTRIFGELKSDRANSVEQTVDGGFIIAGSTIADGSLLNFDVYVIKTNSSGDTLWTKTYGGVNNDQGFSIKQTKDKGYIIAGKSNSFGAGNYDVYVIKTDSAGKPNWSKTYGGINTDIATSILQTRDNGYIIAGATSSFGAGSDDVYIVKTDSSGNLKWSNTFGGVNSEGANSIEKTKDGGYIVLGSSNSYGTGNFDAYLIKFDSTGSSGCNENNAATTVKIVASKVSNVPSLFSSGCFVNAPATISSNGVNVISLCSRVAINTMVDGNAFHIFPSPTNGNFTIVFGDIITKGQIEIYSIIGKMIYSEPVYKSSRQEINIKNNCSGIYIVKINDGEKQYSKKLILE